MFSIDVNALDRKNRFTVPPLGPIGRSTNFLESALITGTSSARSLSSSSDDEKSSVSEDALSDHETPDLWTLKPDQSTAQNLYAVQPLEARFYQSSQRAYSSRRVISTFALCIFKQYA
ncbi:hypothetical protein FRC07_014099 [Ceratobasidium sp. 392]|nr:hypothetical protein FRC07_014099 [Ceratobasidium sp. 392]